MNQIATDLRAAADLIEPEGAWTRTFYAEDGFGNPVDPSSNNARCWCVVGALIQVNGGEVAVQAACRALEHALGRSPLFWNDAEGRTQAEAVAALRAAADRVERGDLS